MREETYFENGIKITSIVLEDTDLASDELKNERLTVCQNCEEYSNESCSQCGCILSTIMMYKVSKCPLNKW